MNKTTLEIQLALSRLGFSTGILDGVMGKTTSKALASADLAGVDEKDALKALKKRVDAEFKTLRYPTLKEMRAFEPEFPEDWVKPLRGAIQLAHILPGRLPMFLAQLAHESAGFRTLVEYATGEAYEGRADLGNTNPGDGVRYKGRGVIQLTGRANYRRYGALLSLRLEDKPGRAARPEEAFKIAAMYWLDRGINTPTDLADIEAVTRKINGGLNGLQDRKARYDKAMRLFQPGAGATTPAPDADDDEAPTVIAPNPTLVPGLEHPPGALPRKRTQPRTVDPDTRPMPPGGHRVLTTEPTSLPPSLQAVLDAQQGKIPRRLVAETPSPRRAVSQPAPPPAEPTPEVTPMLNKEEREDRRQRMRDAVRDMFQNDPEPWLDRYRRTYEVEVQEGSSERRAHERAIKAALDSFVNKAVNVFAHARFRNSAADRYAMMQNKNARLRLRGIVQRVFRVALTDTLSDIKEAKQMAAQLTDRASDAAGEISDFLAALSNVLEGDDGGEEEPPEVIETPTRGGPAHIIERKPGPIAGIPVAANLPGRASVEEIIEAPEAP